ncbi:hypothetical protein QQP08_026133 [Theobroma cacao]|nr:hypothetical protein QQP08_026133 [Theobroma cacao]
MSSATPLPQKFGYLSIGTSYISIAMSAIFFWFFSLLYTHNCTQSVGLFSPIELKWSTSPDNNSTSPVNFPTDISHIKFTLVSSKKTWNSRKPYIEAWWRSNRTRGNIFFDSPPAKDLLPWPSSLPPFRVNKDVQKLRVHLRIFRSVLETFRLGDNENVRWYVMGDDDTDSFFGT